MALSNIFDTGRKPRIESLPHTPAEQAVSQYQQQVLPQISSALAPQAPVIGRSGAAGLATAPANLRALAEQYFPTTQPTTPEAAVAASLPGGAGPLQRQYEEQALPALQAAFQSMGAGRSGQGVAQADELYRRQVSDPLAEALSQTAVQQAQFNQAQELQRRQAQVGLLAPQDQAIATLLGQTLGIKPPEQTVMQMPGEQPGLGTQLATMAGVNALTSGIAGALGGAAGAGAAGAKAGTTGSALGGALVGAGQWIRDAITGAWEYVTDTGKPTAFQMEGVPGENEVGDLGAIPNIPEFQISPKVVGGFPASTTFPSYSPGAANAATMLADPQYHAPDPGIEAMDWDMEAIGADPFA